MYHLASIPAHTWTPIVGSSGLKWLTRRSCVRCFECRLLAHYRNKGRVIREVARGTATKADVMQWITGEDDAEDQIA
jgi:hypothetical protein